jgi:hypothetical protein
MVEPLFFFGAGASKPFDIPTMKEMVTQFRKELSDRQVVESFSTRNRSEDTDAEIKLYDDVESVLREKFGHVDLESVFTVVDAIAQGKTLREIGYYATYRASRKGYDELLNPPPKDSQDTALRLRGRFENFVKRVCWVKAEKLETILDIYLPFLSAVFTVTGGNVSTFLHKGKPYYYNQFWNLFTTNYDNVLEVFWRVGLSQATLNTGFKNDPRTKSEIWNRGSLLEENLRLIKLHGSITWWKEQGTGNIVERDQPPDTTYVPRKFGEQIILYPIQQKDTLVPPYFDMFYALRIALEETKKWIVIGYSFADEIIRAMLARASKKDTVLILVHPQPEIVKKIEDEPGWQGTVRHIQTKFGEEPTNTQVAQSLR